MASNPFFTGGVQATPNTNGGGPSAQFSTAVSVDGTPLRVAVLGIGAGIALWALRKAGFKFNVGV